MKCHDCPAQTLSGLVYERSDQCDGPVDAELYRDGEFIMGVNGICHAISAQRISEGVFTKAELRLRPAVDSRDSVFDVLDNNIESSQAS